MYSNTFYNYFEDLDPDGNSSFLFSSVKACIINMFTPVDQITTCNVKGVICVMMNTTLQFPSALWSISVSFINNSVFLRPAALLFLIRSHGSHQHRFQVQQASKQSSDKPTVRYLASTKRQTDKVNAFSLFLGVSGQTELKGEWILSYCICCMCK